GGRGLRSSSSFCRSTCLATAYATPSIPSTGSRVCSGACAVGRSWVHHRDTESTEDRVLALRRTRNHFFLAQANKHCGYAATGSLRVLRASVVNLSCLPAARCD